ncbi:MAG TPA: hypothetical protein VHF26_21080 [Trebonia sp.]|nr:hypothetical protein [Trebonia sp.]
MSNAASGTRGTDTDLDAALARAIRHLIAQAVSEDDRRSGADEAGA